MGKIAGGYYIKARSISNSAIAHSPPHFREIWDWLLKNANHTDKKIHGHIIKRGQCFTTYAEIIEGLSWKIGYRKQAYTKGQCESAMKFLRKGSMITTVKTTRGLIVTICNYDYYQDPKNYENHNGDHNETDGVTQQDDTINKNDKKDKKERIIKPPIIPLPDFVDPELWEQFLLMRKKIKAQPTDYAMKLLINKLIKLNDAGFDPNESIRISIENNWRGLFEPKNGKKSKAGLHEYLVQVGKEFIEDDKV